jgi:sialic acid synthase SpsE
MNTRREKMNWDKKIVVQGREISIDSPTYFIADIAANHDGELGRAKDLIWRAKEAGADAVKFQHFKAEKIVSDVGFRALGGQIAHQANWSESVFDIYKKYECNASWTSELIETAKEAGIHFFTTPYDADVVNELNERLPAYKIGSGDITWVEFIEFVASQCKPILIATGASAMVDVERAVAATLKHNSQIVLMQCNTNYTGSLENFKYINLRVLQTYAQKYPDMLLGLSDHSPGHATVLGAIAFGARVIEKHFTDDCGRVGPDHGFAMDPAMWGEMVDRSRELENALGNGIKVVEHNEKDAVVVQQRCLRLSRDLAAGEMIGLADIVELRPAPAGAFRPYMKDAAIGQRLVVSKMKGEALYVEDLEAK